MFLGDFKGGALLTENGDRYEERGVWHRYDGARVKHWNEPTTSGTKYSVIIHNNSKEPLVFPRKFKHTQNDTQTTEAPAVGHQEEQEGLQSDS